MSSVSRQYKTGFRSHTQKTTSTNTTPNTQKPITTTPNTISTSTIIQNKQITPINRSIKRHIKPHNITKTPPPTIQKTNTIHTTHKRIDRTQFNKQKLTPRRLGQPSFIGQIAQGFSDSGSDIINITDSNYKDKSIVNQSIDSIISGDLNKAKSVINDNPGRFIGNLIFEGVTNIIPVGAIMKVAKVAKVANKVRVAAFARLNKDIVPPGHTKLYQYTGAYDSNWYSTTPNFFYAEKQLTGEGISFAGDQPSYAYLRSVIVKDSDLPKYKVKTLIEKYSTPISSPGKNNPHITNTAPKVENFISLDLQKKMITKTPPIIQDMYKGMFKKPIGDFAAMSGNRGNEYLFPNELVKNSKTITGYNDKTSKLERIFGAYSSDKLSNELIKIAQNTRTKTLKPEMEDLDDSVEGIISRYKQNTRKPLKPEMEALGFENSYYDNTDLPNTVLEARKESIIKELEKVRKLKPNNYYNFNLRPLFALPIIATTTTKIKSSDKKKIKPTKFGGYERLTKK